MTDPLARLQAALADHYRVERELGRGGMATVYLAEDLKHERMVAVKVLNPDLSSTLGPERFLREIKLAASLQHPHILGVYDSGQTDGILYYVMPFVEGESLRGRIDREQQLPIEEAVQIAREVADALAHAHSHGVIHRDIKPENIMLSGGHAVVADFGIAKAVTEAGAERLTQTGMAIGTPAYMSPEQASGTEGVDGRSDVYSLGCVLFEMLTGRAPFVGPNAMAIMAQHSMEVVPSLVILRPSIPEELEDAVLRALEKVPADRFATAAQFSKALSVPEATTTASQAARRRSTARTAVRPAAGVVWSRHRRVLLAAALIPVAVLGWFGWRLLSDRGPGIALAGPDPSRIAVLYFNNLSDNTDLDLVADGLTDGLIQELSGVEALTVISRNGVLPYRGVPVAPDSLVRALNVGTLVDGTIRQSGERLRLDVSLINAVTGAEIGNTRLERPRSEVLNLQDELVTEVSAFLRKRLGQEIQLRESWTGTRNLQAWERMERAKELETEAGRLLEAGDAGAADLRLVRADSQLAEAAAEDGSWLAPLVKRGWVAYRRARLRDGIADSATMFLDEGMGYAEEALGRRPGDPDALELRGTLRYLRWLFRYEANPGRLADLHAGAEADLQASVLANPEQASAWASLSHLLLGKSQNAEGKIAALKAYEADPFLANADLIVQRLFWGSFDTEDAVGAREWCAEGYRRFPGNYRFTECRLWLYALRDTPPEIPRVWSLVEEYVTLAPPGDRDYFRLDGQLLAALALARAGLADSARSVAARAQGTPEVDPSRDLVLRQAIVFTLLGDQDQAVRLISTYLAANPQFREAMARDESWYFRDLRTNPRYRALIGS